MWVQVVSRGVRKGCVSANLARADLRLRASLARLGREESAEYPRKVPVWACVRARSGIREHGSPVATKGPG